MNIVIGADHAGFELKEALKLYLTAKGYQIIDVGTDSLASVDYPDFARAVGEMVAKSDNFRGILICGSGIGASVAANKIPGVRAAICHDEYSAGQGVEHDDMNVLTLGGRVIGVELARTLVQAYLDARFSGDDRHVRRLNKVLDIEAQYMKEFDGN